MGPCLLALLSAGRTAQAQVPCVMNFGSADLVARVCADVILGKKISCLVRRSAPLGLARGRLTERHFCAVLQRAVRCCNMPCGVAGDHGAVGWQRRLADSHDRSQVGVRQVLYRQR